MRKLTLEIDTLAVETFATGDGDGRAGTVEARESGSYTLCQTECVSDPTFCPCSDIRTVCTPCTV